MKRNKLLSLLLAVTLLFSLSVTAFAAEPSGFTDVPAGSWYEDAAQYVQKQGIMGGTTDTTFSPGNTMTRGMLATVLYRTAGSPAVTVSADFTDVAAGKWYTDGVTWAANSGIISGYGSGTFGVDQPVTREQIATILWRYDGSPNAEKGTDFADESGISAFAATAVDWAREAGIINGRSGNLFAPKESATRAEVASILFQYLSKKAPVFNLETRTVTLNNGIEMPILGLGTYRLSAEETVISVKAALASGYNLIDTAAAYGNEEAVGQGIKESGVAREDIFITTKLWPEDYGNATAAIDTALAKLDVEYIDLLLLHQPWGDNYVAAYQAMERAVGEGKVRSIGLSNFYQNSFYAIMEVATIPPAVLQNERNPYFQNTEMMEHVAPYGTVMMDWFPLGGRGDNVVPTERQKSLFEDETILQIAKAHNKTAPQIILRWHVQSGGIAIPGSRNPEHIRENITIFDFELTDAEMKMIAGLETDIPSFDFREVTEQPDFDSFKPPAQEEKTLVVYFSMPETTSPDDMTTEEANSTVVIDGKVLGNTQYIAYLIEENTGADIFRIEPKTPYPTNHSTLVDFAKEEQNKNARPELLANVENLAQYDTIFVGYPNWWGDMPMILYTFFDTNDFSGKTIIPFNTHGGSGFSGTIGTIAQLEPNATVDRTGFTVSRNDTHNAAPDVLSWLDKLGY